MAGLKAMDMPGDGLRTGNWLDLTNIYTPPSVDYFSWQRIGYFPRKHSRELLSLLIGRWISLLF